MSGNAVITDVNQLLIMEKPVYYTVYYRTGGTENFEWRACIPVPSVEEAIKQVEEIKRGGRKALYEKTDRLNIIGLPETFEG